MNKLGLEIKHIYNSGVIVENDKYQFIFDYYQGDINLKNKKTFVFCSHNHYDHFNPVILDWKNQVEDMTYIFSSDITDIKDTDKIFFIDQDKELSIDNISIKTFGSTDAGVSFLISFDNLSIFHAGDLNWWHWDDDTEEEKSSMENSFKCEIEKIKKYQIDLCFFPVDPRLEKNFFLGGSYFIEEVKPKYFVPIHFREVYLSPRTIINGNLFEKTTILELNQQTPNMYV